jgi:hypothetical protein
MSQMSAAGLLRNPLVMGGAALVEAGSTGQDVQTSMAVMLGKKTAASFFAAKIGSAGAATAKKGKQVQ